MLWVIFVIYTSSAASGIIVKDPLPHGEYEFSYDIEDPATGDSKSLHETRQGGVVSGAYSVLDPDGSRRTVHYTADPKLGFKAVLVQEPVIGFSQHPSHLLSTYPPDQILQSYKESYYQQIPKKRKYFTPAAELLQDKAPINRFYFEPSKKYN